MDKETREYINRVLKNPIDFEGCPAKEKKWQKY